MPQSHTFLTEDNQIKYPRTYHTVSRTLIQKFLRKYFWLNSQETDLLSSSFLRVCKKETILPKISEGTLTYLGNKYSVVWYKCGPASLTHNLLLSFRITPSGEKVVLISKDTRTTTTTTPHHNHITK